MASLRGEADANRAFHQGIGAFLSRLRMEAQAENGGFPEIMGMRIQHRKPSG
jgi:hypothetical protein